MSMNTPLLPLVRQSALDSIPVADITLTYREWINERIDSSIPYTQLRTPQIQTFLIRPLVEKCRRDMNAATLYALFLNMIQYNKESTRNAAVSGIMTTRSRICEIMAMKMLKDYEVDDLIQALTYSFYPLQRGDAISAVPKWERLSGFELAIKAQAKAFLSHPMIIHLVEELWSGSVVMSSSVDNFHRIAASDSELIASLAFSARDSAVRYNYENASIFKLSRLRVPLYRQWISTFSTFLLFFIFIKVLSNRSPKVTYLEIAFWIVSLGFFLDEITGFGNTGFDLYILSLWNLFDSATVFLLLAYAILRFFYLCIPLDAHTAHQLNGYAYDILATVAIFIVPRFLSALDRFPSITDMLISFHRMMSDLGSSLVLILVFYSGFWICIASAFARETFTAREVAYQLMQIFFGYTPVVWDSWDEYSSLGKSILLVYLFISHFLIVTILVTVLTNSFAAIKDNAHEEYCFLRAVNTMTMIKSNSSAPFLYASPFNIIQYILYPLYFLMSTRKYIILNRTIVKVTHLPVLLCIFTYEWFHYRRSQHSSGDHTYKDLSGDLEETMNLSRSNSRVALHKLKDQPRSRSRTNVRSTPLRGRSRSKFSPSDANQTMRSIFAPGRLKADQDALLERVFRKPFKESKKPKPNASMHRTQSDIYGSIKRNMPLESVADDELAPVDSESNEVALDISSPTSGAAAENTITSSKTPSESGKGSTSKGSKRYTIRPRRGTANSHLSGASGASGAFNHITEDPNDINDNPTGRRRSSGSQTNSFTKKKKHLKVGFTIENDDQSSLSSFERYETELDSNYISDIMSQLSGSDGEDKDDVYERSLYDQDILDRIAGLESSVEEIKHLIISLSKRSA
ncbi:hypothetical protein CANCADRAFT_132864 [Tortispora caseinolytica NRRL Y-17796]|uniref:Uncharacterized protein n=1 Tax=Tortispora caseinolytica NRRL Y-17796 TaxID=767744 RepID=A0A1E4TB58_9ASCO|nr:hypothetical protein CANCADRAFT_132864 [Tortispora caseinolytica NRRL Y-17796]